MLNGATHRVWLGHTSSVANSYPKEQRVARTCSDPGWLVPTPREAIGICTIAAHNNVRRQLELAKSAIKIGSYQVPDAQIGPSILEGRATTTPTKVLTWSGSSLLH